MNSRVVLGIVCLLASIATPPADALEKSLAHETATRGQEMWSSSATCTVTYANTCTGWLWVWGGSFAPDAPPHFWRDQDVLGVRYDPCCSGATLGATATYVWSGLYAGYGFTGSIEVSAADASGCPGTLMAQQSFLPVDGLTIHAWWVPAPGPVILTVTLASSLGLPASFVFPSDHPAGGPTGPVAQGYCYPSAREPHSFYYGNNATGRNCPGVPLFDGVGNAEWLNWSAAFSCAVSAQSGMEFRSWGSIKSLYR